MNSFYSPHECLRKKIRVVTYENNILHSPWKHKDTAHKRRPPSSMWLYLAHTFQHIRYFYLFYFNHFHTTNHPYCWSLYFPIVYCTWLFTRLTTISSSTPFTWLCHLTTFLITYFTATQSKHVFISNSLYNAYSTNRFDTLYFQKNPSLLIQQNHSPALYYVHQRPH